MAEDFIYVKMAPEERGGFWEVDDAHPNGEVFVAPDQKKRQDDGSSTVEEAKAVKVARTAAVADALHDKRMIEVGGRSTPKPAEASAPK